MELETEDWKLDEAKIEESARYDGYYAIITNNLGLSTDEVIKIYGGLWKNEESFCILETHLRASPMFVWPDEHIQRHFALCYISLCMMRYRQYLWNEDHAERLLRTSHGSHSRTPRRGSGRIPEQCGDADENLPNVSRSGEDAAPACPEDQHDPDEIPGQHEIGFDRKTKITG